MGSAQPHAGILGMKTIFIEKVMPSNEPFAPTPEWTHYSAGAINPGVSLPSGYSIEGFLLEEIAVGRPVRVLRTIRNGKNALGHFATSPVIAYDDQTFETLNSVYRYRIVEE